MYICIGIYMSIYTRSNSILYIYNYVCVCSCMQVVSVQWANSFGRKTNGHPSINLPITAPATENLQFLGRGKRARSKERWKKGRRCQIERNGTLNRDAGESGSQPSVQRASRSFFQRGRTTRRVFCRDCGAGLEGHFLLLISFSLLRTSSQECRS